VKKEKSMVKEIINNNNMCGLWCILWFRIRFVFLRILWEKVCTPVVDVAIVYLRSILWPLESNKSIDFSSFLHSMFCLNFISLCHNNYYLNRREKLGRTKTLSNLSFLLIELCFLKASQKIITIREFIQIILEK